MKASDPMTADTKMPKWIEERQARQRRQVELSQDEADSFALFCALDTQWHRHAMTGMRIGLDYARIEPVARMLGIEVHSQRFMDLRTLENAALVEFARRAK